MIWEAPDHAGEILAEDGAQLLDAAEAFVCRFVACTPEQSSTVALWVAHAHAIEVAHVTPRLAAQSAEKQSGKTRLLEVLEILLPSPLLAANTSTAALFRVVDADATVAVLLDEVDAIFGPKAGPSAEELRALLNAGYRRGAVVARVVGEGKKMTVKRFKVFAAVALAGIGTLPDTLQDRAVVIRLRRRAPGEAVEKFRRSRLLVQADQLKAALAEWTDKHRDVLEGADPEMPNGLSDRAEELWEILLAIADTAGGDWPERARKAAVTISGALLADDETLGVRLLADCRTVFGDRDRMFTADLLTGLHAIDDAPWSDWYGKPFDAYKLSKYLRPFEVRSRDIRDGDKHAKGYLATDFADSWTRYPPLEVRDKRDKRDAPGRTVTDVPDVTDFRDPQRRPGETGFEFAQRRADAVRARRAAAR